MKQDVLTFSIVDNFDFFFLKLYHVNLSHEGIELWSWWCYNPLTMLHPSMATGGRGERFTYEYNYCDWRWGGVVMSFGLIRYELALSNRSFESEVMIGISAEA